MPLAIGFGEHVVPISSDALARLDARRNPLLNFDDFIRAQRSIRDVSVWAKFQLEVVRPAAVVVARSLVRGGALPARSAIDNLCSLNVVRVNLFDPDLIRVFEMRVVAPLNAAALQRARGVRW